MNISDNYLEVDDKQNDRLYESLFKQITSTEKWSKPEIQREIEDSKIPAFCLKTKDMNSKKKIFVNFCHSSMMKAPTLDLNEEELRAMLTSEANSFTIPLILTQFKSTIDKSGSEALVLDVIINTDFYSNKISFSQLFKTFLITVTLETIERDKYNGLIDKNDWILLKNKKYQEFSAHNINDKSYDKTLVNDLSALLNINGINESNGGNDDFDYEQVITNGNKKFNQNISNRVEGSNGPKTGSVFSQETETTINREDEGVVSADQIQGQTKVLTPKYKLKFDVMNNCLDGRLILPSISDSNEIDLRIGEDRIVLNASNYKLDIFVPLMIKADEVITTFDTFSNILNVKMPLF